MLSHHTPKLCACGCGTVVPNRSKWSRGHNNRDSNNLPVICQSCGKAFHQSPSQTRKFCSLACYNQKRANTDPYWSKVMQGPDCWKWTGGKSKGYGVFLINGIPTYAHRYSWELHFGPISEGMFVCHRCDNPECTNPDHLFLGTIQDNNQDKVTKGRHPSGENSGPHKHPERMARGEDQGLAKLTDDKVRQIKALLVEKRMSQSAIGALFGVVQGTIAHIAAGKTWKHVT